MVAMSESDVTAKVREALAELRQYLSDAIAPLVAADSIALLLQCPPDLIVAEIQAWMATQYRKTGADAPVSDYLFHALRKIYLIGEFELIPKESMEGFLRELKRRLLEICPENDRQLLRVNFENLGYSEMTSASPVTLLHRPATSQPLRAESIVGGVGAEDLARLDRRLALLLQRLERPAASIGQNTAGGPSEERSAILAQALAEAANTARTGAEFNHYKEGLRRIGVDTSMQEIFRALGRSLPEWASPQIVGAALPASPERKDTPLEAMHRIVAMEQDPHESEKRVHEIVQAAVEQLNAGSLPRGATILGLAALLVSEKKINPTILDGIQTRARESIDATLLRKWAEDRSRHVLLRKVFDFFPGFSPQSLLDALQSEQVRDRRRSILALLAAHGERVREKVRERLERSVNSFGDSDWQFQRNLLYLLRTTEGSETPAEAELNIIIKLSELGRPIGIMKESITSMGQMKNDRAEKALTMRLGEIERVLRKPGESPYEATELLAVVDRIVSALARIGTPRACRTVATHGLRRQPHLGNTVGRLAELAGHDLSPLDDVVDEIIKAMTAELPRKVLGLRVQGDRSKVMSYIAALSATGTNAVREAFEEIAGRFPDEEFGKEAARALNRADSTTLPGSAASLTGDLQVFGLPPLLQNLAQTQATGILTISGPDGSCTSTLAYQEGRIIACQAGHRGGISAVYQLFERPVPGTFAFVSESADEDALGPLSSLTHTDPLPLVLEGMRRYDELRRADALVSDAMIMKPTGTKPTRFTEEQDSRLQKTVWSRAASGATSFACEEGLQPDSYRVRRLLVHWVEEGSLQPQ